MYGQTPHPLSVTNFGSQHGAGYCWLLCIHGTWFSWGFQERTMTRTIYEPAACGWLAQVGNSEDVLSNCQNHLFWGSSLFLPFSSLAAIYALPWWNGNLHLGQADKLQNWVSPPVRTRATLPSVSTRAIWAFLPVGSDVYLMLRTVWGMRCCLGTFGIWSWCVSDVKDLLGALPAIWAFLPFGSDICLLWGLFVSTERHLSFFASWFLISDYHWGLFVLGKCLFGTLPVTLRKGLWQIYHLECECVFHLCVCYFCCLKMGNSGFIH